MGNRAKEVMNIIHTRTVNGVPVNKVDIMKALSENGVKINNTVESEIEQLLVLAKQADADEIDIEISPNEIVYKFLIVEEKSSVVQSLIEKEENQEFYNILKSASANASDQVTFTQKRNFDSNTEQTTTNQDKKVEEKKVEISPTTSAAVSIIGGVGCILAGALTLSKVFSD